MLVAREVSYPVQRTCEVHFTEASRLRHTAQVKVGELIGQLLGQPAGGLLGDADQGQVHIVSPLQQKSQRALVIANVTGVEQHDDNSQRARAAGVGRCGRGHLLKSPRFRIDGRLESTTNREPSVRLAAARATARCDLRKCSGAECTAKELTP
jgi:hypothetical protein